MFALLRVPLGRPPMQLRNELGLLVEQARLQHVREQVVVAIPPAPVVEGDQEQVPPIERFECGPATVLPGHGIAQGSAHAGQDRCLQQEAPDIIGLTVPDLLDEVIDDVAVIAGEVRDESLDVVSPLHRQSSQLERGDPAFGPALQGGDIALRQSEGHHPVEIGRGLVRRETQIGGTDLHELPSRTDAGERQGRVGAGRDHQVHIGWKVVEQEFHAGMDLVRVDHVVVVQHQHDLAGLRVQVVEQGRKDGLDRW